MSSVSVPEPIVAAREPKEEQPAITPRATYLLVVLFLINLLNFYDRQIAAVVTEPIRIEFSLTDSQLGWMGTAFTLLYAFIGVPLGRLADGASRTRLLAIGVATWSAFTAMSGVASSYVMLFVARLGVGVGEASCAPASNALIADIYPPEKRGRAIGTFMLGLPLGILLTSVISGYIARAYGWRAAFLVATVPGVLLALIIARIPDPKRASRRAAVSVQQPAAQGSWFAPFAELWSISSLRWIIVSGALVNFNSYAVNSFLPAYLMRYHGMSLASASVASGLTLGAVGVISLVFGGIIADKARRRGADTRLRMGAFAFVLSTPCVLFALMLPRGTIVPFVMLMGTGWMLFYLYYVTTYPAIQDVVRPSLRGTAMAVYFFWMYVLGGAFGSAILGMLSDRFARRAMEVEGISVISENARAVGLHDAFMIVPMISVLVAAVLFAAARAMKRDLRATVAVS